MQSPGTLTPVEQTLRPGLEEKISEEQTNQGNRNRLEILPGDVL